MKPVYRRMLSGLKTEGPGRASGLWHLYIVECVDGTLYTGITNDIDRRVKQHNEGKGARYTRTRRPVRLLYHEACGGRSEALIREAEVKGMPREKKGRLARPESGTIGAGRGGIAMGLKEKHCVPCEGGVPKMTQGEIRKRLPEIPGWEGQDDRLHRTYRFKNFVESMKFVNRMADVAEAEGHHPDFNVHYNEVRVTLWTHAVGGLSENDFILAAKLNEL